jgi:hypothetical protein
MTGGYGCDARGIKFCSGGPKNYAFEVLKGDCSTKVV